MKKNMKQPIIFSAQNELKIINIRHVYTGKNRTRQNETTYFDLYELSNDGKTWIKHSTDTIQGFLKTENGILKKLAKKYE